MLRFYLPLIEPDVQISRIRLSDESQARVHGERWLNCASENNPIRS